MNFEIKKPIAIPQELLLAPSIRPIIAKRFQFIRTEVSTRDNTVYALVTTMAGNAEDTKSTQRAKFRIALFTTEKYHKHNEKIAEHIREKVEKEMKGQLSEFIEREFGIRYDKQVRTDVFEATKKEILNLK